MQTNLCCTYIFAYMEFHWKMIKLSVITNLKKTDFPSPNL